MGKDAAAENVLALVESALKNALDGDPDGGLVLFKAAVVSIFRAAAFHDERNHSHLVEELLALAHDVTRPAVLQDRE